MTLKQLNLVTLTATECWEKVPPIPLTPQPRSQMVALLVPDTSSSSLEELPGYSRPLASAPSLARQAQYLADRIKEGAENILDSKHATVRYSFIAPDYCSEEFDSDDDVNNDDRTSNKILKYQNISKDSKRPTNFLTNSRKNCNKLSYSSTIMRDLNKVRMSLLSPTNSNSTLYSVFYNQSSESINSSQFLQETSQLPESMQLPETHNSKKLPKVQNSMDQPELPSKSDLSGLSQHPTLPGNLITKSDSQFTFQSYSCSSRSSTLSSTYRENLVNLTVEADENEDEGSTISGYDSLEYLNSLDTGLPLYNPHYSEEDKHSSYAEALKCPVSECESEGVQMRERSEEQNERVYTNFVPPERSMPLPEEKRGDKVNLLLPKLVMYVVGGREVGQVNSFTRNISIWKLRLQ